MMADKTWDISVCLVFHSGSGQAPQIQASGMLGMTASPNLNFTAISNSLFDIAHPREITGTCKKAEAIELAVE